MPQRLRLDPRFRRQSQRVELDGAVYGIVLTWRDRTAAWYLDLYDASGAPIALGRKITTDWSPTQTSTEPGLPPGALAVSGPDPYAREDLDDRLNVYYYALAELLAIPASTVADDLVIEVV